MAEIRVEPAQIRKVILELSPDEAWRIYWAFERLVQLDHLAKGPIHLELEKVLGAVNE